MILDDLGISGGHVTIGGATIAAITWIWRKISGVESKVNAIELKIAESYVTRPEFKALEEKLDNHNQILTGKIDKVNDSILTLTNLLIKTN